MLKYKILGFAVIGFITLWMVLFFSSDSGYPRALYDINNVNMIVIDKGDQELVIKSKDTVNLIVNVLSKSKKLNSINKPNINRNSYRLTFYYNNGKDYFDLMVSENVYHGLIVSYHGSYYRGDSIYAFIKSIKQ